MRQAEPFGQSLALTAQLRGPKDAHAFFAQISPHTLQSLLQMCGRRFMCADVHYNLVG